MGCATTTPPPLIVPPRPIINPVELQSCDAHLSTITTADPTFDDVLAAHGQDQIIYDRCRCRVEALKQTLCDLTQTVCEVHVCTTDIETTKEKP